MIVKIVLDNIEYDILYSPINGKENIIFYKPLPIALWSKLTEERKKQLIIKNPYNQNHKILNFNKLLQCYSHINDITLEYNTIKGKNYNEKQDKYKYFNNNKQNCCCCGIPIKNEFIIRNIDTNMDFIIGSECIKWWKYGKDISNIKKIIKAMQNKEEIPKFCPFCKSSRNCINCNEKHTIKHIFRTWRIYSKMKLEDVITNLKSIVKFGKYKNQNYFRLCQDKYYISYILTNDFNENTKQIIRKYIKYKNIFNTTKYKNKFNNNKYLI